MKNIYLLSADIFKSSRNGKINDFTLGGESSKNEECWILGYGGYGIKPEDLEEFCKTHFVVELIQRNIGGRIYKHLQPYNKTGGFMFGGNFAKCSDSRFPNDYPLSIHDRQEP